MATMRQKKKDANGKRCGNYYARFKERGRFLEFSLETANKHEAAERLAQLVVERRKGFYGLLLKKRLFEDAAKEWLDSKRLELKRNSIDYYELRLKHGPLKFFKGNLIGDITPADIETFKNERAKVISNSTVNAELTMPFTIFDHGFKLGYVRENPVRVVKRLKHAKQRFDSPTDLSRSLR